jgi:uncharacterized damage-inducible protein DinB
MSRRQLLLKAISATPTDVELLVARVDAESARRRPDGHEWSVSDVVNHLIYVEEPVRERFQRVVEEDCPRVPHIHPNEEAHDLDIPLQELVARFGIAREKTRAYLTSLGLGSWQRPAVHETLGETRLLNLVQYLVDHDTEHLNQLSRMLPIGE